MSLLRMPVHFAPIIIINNLNTQIFTSFVQVLCLLCLASMWNT